MYVHLFKPDKKEEGSSLKNHLKTTSTVYGLRFPDFQLARLAVCLDY